MKSKVPLCIEYSDDTASSGASKCVFTVIPKLSLKAYKKMYHTLIKSALTSKLELQARLSLRYFNSQRTSVANSKILTAIQLKI